MYQSYWTYNTFETWQIFLNSQLQQKNKVNSDLSCEYCLYLTLLTSLRLLWNSETSLSQKYCDAEYKFKICVHIIGEEHVLLLVSWECVCTKCPNWTSYFFPPKILYCHCKLWHYSLLDILLYKTILNQFTVGRYAKRHRFLFS